MHKVKKIAQEMTPERVLFFVKKIKEYEQDLALHHRRMSRKSIRVKAVRAVYSENEIWKNFKLTMLEFTEYVSVVLSELPQEIVNLFGEKVPVEPPRHHKSESFEEWQSRAPWRGHFLNGEIGGLYGFDH